MFNTENNDKNIKISFSLLMRLFEWCHEDAKDDVEMHKVMEKLVAFNDGVNPLTIDVYDCLINNVNCPTEVEPLTYGNCTEYDMSDAVEKVKQKYDNDLASLNHCIEPSEPYVITFQGDEEEVPSNENLDKDVEEEIQNLINMSKM